MGAVHIAGLEHLSPSGASVLVDCERRYHWQYKHGLGRDERSEPLAMGGGLAEALEFGLERGLVEYRDRRPIADGWTDPVAYEREGWIGEAIIGQAHRGYLNRYYDAELAREVTYFAALPGTDRLLQVRVDGVAPTYMCEDKLRSASSMRADAIENEVRQGRQISAEVYGHWRATDEILPVKLRSTKKPDPRPLKKAASQDEVITIVNEHFEKDGVFNEFVCTRTREQLLEFEHEFAALAVRAEALLASDTPIGARNTDSCNKYGRTCPALSFCQGLAPTPTTED